MATLNRVRCVWGGPGVVGGGLSTHYLDTPVAGYIAEIAEFYEEVLKYAPPFVSVSIPNSGDQINSETGDIIGGWSEGSPSTKNGTSATATYAAGVGARIVWNTVGRTNNRLVRGSTFIVPLASSQYANDGTLDNTMRGDLQFRADTLLTALGPSFVIWSRPNGVAAGTVNSIVGSTAPDKVSWLRSRRT